MMWTNEIHVTLRITKGESGYQVEATMKLCNHCGETMIRAKMCSPLHEIYGAGVRYDYTACVQCGEHNMCAEYPVDPQRLQHVFGTPKQQAGEPLRRVISKADLEKTAPSPKPNHVTGTETKVLPDGSIVNVPHVQVGDYDHSLVLPFSAKDGSKCLTLAQARQVAVNLLLPMTNPKAIEVSETPDNTAWIIESLCDEVERINEERRTAWKEVRHANQQILRLSDMVNDQTDEIVNMKKHSGAADPNQGAAQHHINLLNAQGARIAALEQELIHMREQYKEQAAMTDRLHEEVHRLKAGLFNEDEVRVLRQGALPQPIKDLLQAMCHDFPQENERAFKDGCDEYQRQLFGTSRTDDLLHVIPPGPIHPEQPPSAIAPNVTTNEGVDHP